MNSPGWCPTLILLVFAVTPCATSVSLRAVFDMSGIKGQVRFTQTGNGNTTIMVNLTGLSTKYIWNVHEYPVVYRGNAKHTCQPLYTGGLFDPSNRTSTQCNSSMPQMCAVGDLSGRHGYLESTTRNLIDPDLPLSGPSSIFGRSLVLYDSNSTLIACALIDSSDNVISAVARFRGPTSGITGTIRLRQSRLSASMDSSVEVDLFLSNEAMAGLNNLTLSLSDKQLPEEGIPSYEGVKCPTIAEIGRKLSNVNIPLARHGPSSQRFLLNLHDLPLSGVKSILGKTLVLSHDNSSVICASVYEVLPLEAEALFDVDGVKGWFHFKQNSELSPTVVTAEVKGLGSKANTYHVHVFRVLESAMRRQRNMNNMCGGEFVAGHWKPYGTDSLQPGKGTGDQYEVGDMSGKYGAIGNSDIISLVKHDYNLPLFGAKSILFRSMVIHYNNGSRWVCTNINPKTPTFHFKAQSKFVGPDFNGTITVEQASFIRSYAASHITTFFLDLKHMNSSLHSTRNHKWHIHDNEVTGDQMHKMGERCISAKGHYNPYRVSLKSKYSTTCGPMNVLRCELGDLSGKMTNYMIGGGKNRFTESENYFAGLHSILGRSIVVHTKDGGGPRLGCASLEAVSPNFIKKELTFITAPARNFSSVLAAALNVKPWQVVHTVVKNYKERCQTASFVLINNATSNLNYTFENLKRNWPDSLKSFTPSAKDICSSISVTPTSQDSSRTLATTPSGNAANLRTTYLMTITACVLAWTIK